MFSGSMVNSLYTVLSFLLKLLHKDMTGHSLPTSLFLEYSVIM